MTAGHDNIQTYEYTPTLLLDVLRAPDTVSAPAIIWLHGGGWRMQNRAAAPDLWRHFASRGFVMVSIDYRLAPATTFPGQLFDVRDAIRWVREHSAEVGVDPDRIGLWGSSAGGHLAALAGVHSTTRVLEGEHPDVAVSAAVAAVVEGYGPADLPLMADLAGSRTAREATSPEASLLGGPIRDRLPMAIAASPARQVTGPTPPFLILHGLADTLVPHVQSERLYEALSAAGTDVTLYLIKGFGHGFLNPGDVLELGPDMTLDQGHLERDPTAQAHVRASTDAARSFTHTHPHASFDTIDAFFTRVLHGATTS